MSYTYAIVFPREKTDIDMHKEKYSQLTRADAIINAFASHLTGNMKEEIWNFHVTHESRPSDSNIR